MLLRTRISIVAALVLALLLAMLAGANALRENIQQRRLADAVLASQLALWHEARDIETARLRRGADTLAASGTFAKAVEARQREAALAALTEAGLDPARPDATVTFVAVFAGSRDLIWAAGRDPEQALLDASTFDRLLAGHEISGLQLDADNRPLLMAARAIALPGDTGVIAVGRTAQPAMQRLGTVLRGTVTLVSRRGQLAATTDPELWKAAAVNPSPRVASFEELDLGTRLYTVSSVPVLDIAGGAAGALTVISDRTEALSTSRTLTRLSVAGTLVLALVGVVGLNVYLWRSFRPLQSAIDALAALSRGDASVRLEVQGSDEIGRIGQAVTAFRRDAQTLAATRALRERVRRRQESVIRREINVLARALDDAERQEMLTLLDRRDEGERADDPLRRLAGVMGTLRGRIIEQHDSLTKMVVELREALRVKTQFIALQQELSIARDLQQAILPRQWPEHPAYTLWATMRPAKEVGGDFYDHFDVDGRRGLVVADVSGKGISAGLFAMVSKTLLRSLATQATVDLGAMVARVNDGLAVGNDSCLFVTVFYGELDPATGRFEYVNAGHPPPLLVHTDGTVEWLAVTDGMALGVMDGLDYGRGEVQLRPGDTLLVFSDGITEAMSPTQEEYGTERLATLFAGRVPADPREAAERMIAAVDAFAQGHEQSDDITCMALEWGGPR